MSSWKSIAGPAMLAGVLLASFPVMLIYMSAREASAQRQNRARCEAASGRYLQHGDKYWSGICVRPDGLLWERLP